MSFLLAVIGIACAVWVIYDVVTTQKSMETLHKVLWIAAALFFSIITAIVYYLLKKR